MGNPNMKFLMQINEQKMYFLKGSDTLRNNRILKSVTKYEEHMVHH